jgi:hypothetical protein
MNGADLFRDRAQKVLDDGQIMDREGPESIPAMKIRDPALTHGVDFHQNTQHPLVQQAPEGLDSRVVVPLVHGEQQVLPAQCLETLQRLQAGGERLFRKNGFPEGSNASHTGARLGMGTATT